MCPCLGNPAVIKGKRWHLLPLSAGVRAGKESILFSKHGPFHIDRKAKEAREHKGLAVTSSHSEVDTDNPKASPLLWTLRKARTGDPS